MIAFHYFQAIGRIPLECKRREWCLHHIDVNLKTNDPTRYNEWRIEDLEPMLTSEHIKLHQQLRGQMPETTRTKISDSLKGHEVSYETRAKISESCKGKTSWLKGTKGLVTPWNKGKTNCYSEETLEKMGAASRGRHLTEETKQKISQSSTGKKMSDEAKAKISLALAGHTVSDEARAKMSEAKKGKLLPKHTAAHNKKIGASKRGKVWATDGKKTIMANRDEIPEGFTLGRAKK